MSPIESFEAVCDSLIGQPISHIWRGHGSAIFIEFGHLTPRSRSDGTPANPDGDVSLCVEWSWRIEDAHEIICGSWSDEELWEPALNHLKKAKIVQCELFGFLPEVAVTTDTGLRFLTFSTTDGQPRWHLVDRRGSLTRWFSIRNGKLHLGDGTEPAL
jgi:hypothetical protein